MHVDAILNHIPVSRCTSGTAIFQKNLRTLLGCAPTLHLTFCSSILLSIGVLSSCIDLFIAAVQKPSSGTILSTMPRFVLLSLCQVRVLTPTCIDLQTLCGLYHGSPRTMAPIFHAAICANHPGPNHILRWDNLPPISVTVC